MTLFCKAIESKRAALGCVVYVKYRAFRNTKKEKGTDIVKTEERQY
jgi:hypothetical protein